MIFSSAERSFNTAGSAEICDGSFLGTFGSKLRAQMFSNSETIEIRSSATASKQAIPILL